MTGSLFTCFVTGNHLQLLSSVREEQGNTTLAHSVRQLHYFSNLFSETLTQFSSQLLQRTNETRMSSSSFERPSQLAVQDTDALTIAQQKLTRMVSVIAVIQRLPHKDAVQKLLAALLETNSASAF